LSIAKAVVEAHGGSISAQSQGRGRGASFVVDLPRAAAGPVSEAALPQPEATRSTGALRVLLVEDHPDTARALSKVLRLSGHQIEIAGGVASGLRLAAAQTFDLVISDIGLPDGTGYDLMRQIRQKHPIPGIALTGFGMDADVQSSADAGFATHITKPVELDQLHEVIARVMSRPALDQSAR
jgi:CheY-like chemotaxis protein